MTESLLTAPDTAVDLAPELEARLRGATLRVWIDQDLCTGDGICEDLCPEVFVILDDGIAYVHEGDRVMNDPGQESGLARVAPQHEDDVVAAAVGCPASASSSNRSMIGGERVPDGARVTKGREVRRRSVSGPAH